MAGIYLFVAACILLRPLWSLIGLAGPSVVAWLTDWQIALDAGICSMAGFAVWNWLGKKRESFQGTWRLTALCFSIAAVVLAAGAYSTTGTPVSVNG